MNLLIKTYLDKIGWVRLDISALNFWIAGQQALFDVKVLTWSTEGTAKPG